MTERKGHLHAFRDLQKACEGWYAEARIDYQAASAGLEEAGSAKEIASWLAEEAPKWDAALAGNLELGECLSDAEQWARGARLRVQEATRGLCEQREHRNHLQVVVHAASDYVTTTGSTTAAIVTSFLPEKDLKRLQETHGFRLPSEMPGGADLQRLDGLMAQLDPKLVELRKAAWDALRSRSGDYLRHAASSMRALLEHLFNNHAPDKQVRF